MCLAGVQQCWQVHCPKATDESQSQQHEHKQDCGRVVTSSWNSPMLQWAHDGHSQVNEQSTSVFGDGTNNSWSQNTNLVRSWSMFCRFSVCMCLSSTVLCLSPVLYPCCLRFHLSWSKLDACKLTNSERLFNKPSSILVIMRTWPLGSCALCRNLHFLTDLIIDETKSASGLNN